jgi:hypothetical protein
VISKKITVEGDKDRIHHPQGTTTMCQPVIQEHHYELGWNARNRDEKVYDCQTMLDNTSLESDQYDSFWAGYHDCDRWLADGETTEDKWFPSVFIEGRLASIMRIKTRMGTTPNLDRVEIKLSHDLEELKQHIKDYHNSRS